MRTFELRQVEDILLKKHTEYENKLGAFKARMRVLRDIGIPALEGVGKGGRETFSKSDIWEIHVALRLTRVYVPPRLITEIIKDLRRPPRGKGSYVVIMFMDTFELRTIVLKKLNVGVSIDGWIQLGNPRDFMVIKLDDEIASYR